MNRTGIEYLDYTWNPIAMRCTHVSPACDNCWHLRMCNRMGKNWKLPDADRLAFSGDGSFVLRRDELDEPELLLKPSRIGVQFMGDLFHESVSMKWILKVFEKMQQASQHTFLLLTKRPQRVLDFCFTYGIGSGNTWPANVYQGVTVEDQTRADERIPLLLQIPAAKRWVSYEPALGPVDFSQWMHRTQGWNMQDEVYLCPECGFTGVGKHFSHYNIGDDYDSYCPKCGFECDADEAMKTIGNIDWIVAGGETGPGARPSHPDWFRKVRDDCKEAGVPFMFKQWGEWAPVHGYNPKQSEKHFCFDRPSKQTPNLLGYNGMSLANMFRVGRKAAGRLLDGVEHMEVIK